MNDTILAESRTRSKPLDRQKPQTAALDRCRCSALERLYPRKTLESTRRPPETLWNLPRGRQTTSESVWRSPD
ncbi:hypothetical protein PoB_000440200 [Plakobranchus ocellatus]|uniref:Uncharacterized protein n=1 Tax=Plakobranchus ocellatus TaxID=259542 RepID=A0AAV3Y574_9GAST|nr:hypothetical protein PoB_000440200 [Plakobranchus ocellatus]